MNFFKALFVGSVMTCLILTVGCQSDKVEGETIPQPLAGPGSGEKIGPWEEGNLSLADKDGWVPISTIKLPTIYFAYDQDRIGTSERAKLESVANYLSKNSSICLIIEGHCDERGSEEYNRALGERRAISIKDYLVNLGVSDFRMKTVSYGEERPAVEGSTISAFSKNRRGDLIAAKKPAK